MSRRIFGGALTAAAAQDGLPAPASETPTKEPAVPENVVPLPRPAPEPFITTAQLAACLGCSARWVEARAREGMPAYRWGGMTRYRLSEVLDWLRERGAA